MIHSLNLRFAGIEDNQLFGCKMLAIYQINVLWPKFFYLRGEIGYNSFWCIYKNPWLCAYTWHVYAELWLSLRNNQLIHHICMKYWLVIFKTLYVVLSSWIAPAPELCKPLITYAQCTCQCMSWSMWSTSHVSC